MAPRCRPFSDERLIDARRGCARDRGFADSPLEGTGFEPSVPPEVISFHGAQHVGALLRLGPARGDHHRDLGDAELPRSEYPGVARNQAPVLTHQRRRRPAPFLDARGDCGDLGIRVGPRVARIGDQPIDRPALDLVGRPRPLISGRLSRAGARAPRRGKCWRFFAPADPLQAALRLAPLIIPVV
jgi:hypothetical protein